MRTAATSAAPAIPTPTAASAAPAASGSASTAPPGFAAAGIRAAESPSLVALDPTEDETTALEPEAPVAAAPQTEAIAGSALLATAVRAAPRPADLRRVGREREATVRVGVAAILVLALILLGGPPLLRLLDGIPLVGSAIEQLRVLGRYPGALGVKWFLGAFGALTAAGIVVAQMEARANKLGTRQDPDTRLNVALGGLLGLTLTACAMTLMRGTGWISAGASTAFFLALILCLPLARFPGARAMAAQGSRAWAYLLLAAIVGFAVQPSLVTAVLIALAGRQVHRRWSEISGPAAHGAHGASADLARPVDPTLSDPATADPAAVAEALGELEPEVTETDRRSALLILLVVVIVGSFGMRATELPPVVLQPDTFESPTTLPGAERGPTIAPPTP